MIVVGERVSDGRKIKDRLGIIQTLGGNKGVGTLRRQKGTKAS